ncbi:HAD-IA family hydrolase [Rhizobium mesoamericanum]|uniref:Phosphoglycolate phosphatase protein n=1 Tax=Rhizobium mesoamericanum STM3625 TaxID=1211777 RepID=K0PWR7_9HYPH|nr:HAD-IA family hydrolase [Rhizobium mesoamericanum]CCM75757.1 Phosphoglycolate phosphatase protein [Rhizobium mesoamericanum STM3625]
MKLALFDCDGTLVDSAALIHEVMTRTFVHFGYDRPDVSLTKSIIGLTLDIAITRMQGKPHVDDEAIAMTEHYRAIYSGVRDKSGMDVPLFNGIKPLIDELARNDDVLIGAVTGKSRRGLVHILETHGLAPHFIVTRTADDCPSKPHPAMVVECCDETGMNPTDAIVIGDAVYDMQMAKAAGAKAVGVSWGYASVNDLMAAGADGIVHHPSDLLSYFSEVKHA